MRDDRPPGRLRWLKWALLVAGVCGAIGFLGLLGLLWHYERDPTMPKLDALSEYKPKITTRIYSADGRLIGEVFKERRSVVPIDSIPKHVKQAFIAAEDAEFERHQGLDYAGMLRALVKLVFSGGETRQGGSTITQQVIKTFLLTPEKTLSRKAKEIVLARRLEKRLKKDEILYLYLTQIYFGHGRYGVEEASRYYFGKGVAEIDLAEAALLAALPKAPEEYSPVKHPEKARRRRDEYVLPQMARIGAITREQALKLAAEPIRLSRDIGREAVGSAPEVVDLVKDELKKRFGDPQMYEVGLEVRTTIDSRLQEAARDALEQGLRELDGRHGYRRPVHRLPLKKGEAKPSDKALAAWMAKQRAAIGKQLGGAETPSLGKVYEALVTAVHDADPHLEAELGKIPLRVALAGEERYNPGDTKPSERFRIGDVVRVRLTGTARAEGHADAVLELGPQAAFVAIDPATREIKALVGGYGFQPGAFNRATRAQRQPGSSFKPFVYGAALESGRYTPASVVNDAPEVFALWKPQNSHHDFRGPIRLRPALAASINTIAIKLLADVGIEPVRAFAARVGIKSEIASDLSIALGSSVVTPLEHTNAYATFAAGGRYSPPVLITSIGGETLGRPEATDAIRPEVAYVMTSLMQSVISEGTGRAAARLGRPLAGKTGTSNGGRDAWFVGYAPDLVAGAWVGFDDMRPLGKGEEGSKAALPIWIRFMQKALAKRPAVPFAQPAAVMVQRIDPATGLVAREGQADALEEVFVEGTAPTQVAPEAGQAPDDYLNSQFEEATPTAVQPPKPAPPKSKAGALPSGETELTQ